MDTGERPDLCARRQERPRRSEPLPVVAVLGGADRPCGKRSLPLREGPSRSVRVGAARWVVPLRAQGRRSRRPAGLGGDAGVSGITYAIHLEEGDYQAAEFGDVYERGTTYLSKPHTIVFVPATCPGTGLGVLRPVEYTWTETIGGVSWEKVGGGTCAGPQFATGDPWTRAPGGQIAVESGHEIALMDAGGFIERRLTDQHETDPNVWPDWSPDGSRIVFAGASQEGYDLYTMAPDGTGTERITHEPGDETMPSWSPDGTRIAFAFDDLGAPDFETGIVVMGTSGEARADVGDATEPSWWSPRSGRRMGPGSRSRCSPRTGIDPSPTSWTRTAAIWSRCVRKPWPCPGRPMASASCCRRMDRSWPCAPTVPGIA